MVTDSSINLTNHFLLAMPGMRDPNFLDSVIYICEHSAEGTMGLIINKPMDIPLSQVFEQFDLEYPEHLGKQHLMAGGPVQTDRGFVLHRPAYKHWESTLKIAAHINLTASRDIIIDIAGEKGPPESLITLGYAGWGAGQLEKEIAENAWLTLPADPDVIFQTPFNLRAQVAAASIGIDLSRLSSSAGHA